MMRANEYLKSDAKLDRSSYVKVRGYHHIYGEVKNWLIYFSRFSSSKANEHKLRDVINHYGVL